MIVSISIGTGCQHNTYCPYFGDTQPLVVGAADEVEVFEVAVVVVGAAEVDVTRVVLALEVVLTLEVVGPDGPPPEHPMRLEVMAISSYQNVLAAEPYDSQPKYTPEILGTNLLLVHPLALALETPGPTVRPAMAAPLSQVSIVPSVPRWYSRHCHVPAGRSAEVATPCGERSGRVASLSWRLYIMISIIPPNRRCWFVPSAASGITMKVTWSDVRAFEDCLAKFVSAKFS
jgi:hypothetical protein